MAWKSAVRIELDEAERRELEARTRRRKISRADAMRAEIVLLAADGTTNLPAAATHWSTRSMAKASGLSVSTVHRIWRAFSLQPHRSETFKLSTDPLFVDKSLPRT